MTLIPKQNRTNKATQETKWTNRTTQELSTNKVEPYKQNYSTNKVEPYKQNRTLQTKPY